MGQFSYRATKGGRVLVCWRGRRAVVPKARRAQKLLAGLPGIDPARERLALAKSTGNFKRGNERLIN